MFLKMVVFLHIICACVWTGGHLVLALSVLPKAIKHKSFDIIRIFELHYERIGIPSLLFLIITGVYLATNYSPNFFELDLSNHYTLHIFIKLILLVCTLALALHARLVLIPAEKLIPLAYHIVLVTILAILFVFVGFSARSGGIL